MRQPAFGTVRRRLVSQRMIRRGNDFSATLSAARILRFMLLILGVALLVVVWRYVAVLPDTMPGPVMGMIALLGLAVTLVLVAIWSG